MSTPALDCLCAGIVVADHVCAPLARLPAPGELLLTERMDLAVGGNAANVAIDLATLGPSVGLVGAVGDDIFGRFVSETLSAASVNVDRVRTIAGCDTSGTLVVNTLQEDRRFIHSLGANARFTGAELTREVIASARMLYVGGYLVSEAMSPDLLAQAFQTARELGVTTILDVVLPGPGEYVPRLKPVLPWVDVFLPNTDEATLLTGETQSTRQAEILHTWGPRTVVVTCGENGAILLSEESRLRVESCKVPVIDGTGSGDAFTAGFIHGLLDEQSPAECLRRGSGMGAGCVQSIGASTGAFTAGQLAKFCATHPLEVSNW